MSCGAQGLIIVTALAMTQIQLPECCWDSASNIVIINSNICGILTMSLHLFFYSKSMKSEITPILQRRRPGEPRACGPCHIASK